MDSIVCLDPPCVAGALTTFDLVCLAVAACLGILFLQSGIDKVVDRKGNTEWLTGHFAKSPLARLVVPMLGVITVVELAAGLLSAIGFVVMLTTGHRMLASLGAIFAVSALLLLFFGQRMAKDYAGAAALVPYLILAAGGLLVMGIP